MPTKLSDYSTTQPGPEKTANSSNLGYPLGGKKITDAKGGNKIAQTGGQKITLDKATKEGK